MCWCEKICSNHGYGTYQGCCDMGNNSYDPCCHEKNCCWKCMDRWNCKPRALFCSWDSYCGLLFAILALIFFGIGGHVYNQAKISDYEPVQITTQFNQSQTFYKTIIQNNCTVNTIYNYTSSLPSCTDKLTSTGECYYHTCTDYEVSCTPCYYVCYTLQCWVPQQQENCLNATDNYKCNVTFGTDRTTYVCTQDPNNTIATCRQECTDYNCKADDTKCNCVNGQCLAYQNKICQYENEIDYILLTSESSYVMDGQKYHYQSHTYHCPDEQCVKTTMTYTTIPFVMHCNKNNHKDLITNPPAPNFKSAITYLVFAFIFTGLTIWICWNRAFFWCRKCKRPEPTPKPVLAPVQLTSPPSYRSALQQQSQTPTQGAPTPQTMETQKNITVTFSPDVTCGRCQKPLKSSEKLIVLQCNHICHKTCADLTPSMPCAICHKVNIQV